MRSRWWTPGSEGLWRKPRGVGLADNTLFVLLSDHGILLGEHGTVGKKASAMYNEIVDVPFLIRHPNGKGAGEESDYYASTHDIAPTVLGALSIKAPQEICRART